MCCPDTGEKEMPACGECSWQIKLKILTKGSAIKSLKARRICMGASICLSKGVHVQILQERGERRIRGGTPLIVLQVCWVERAPHGMAIQSDSAALLQPSWAAAAAQSWEQPLSVHVWGDCRGERKGTVFLQRNLCQGIRGANGDFSPVKITSWNVPSDRVAPQHKSRASRRQKGSCEKLSVVWILSRKCGQCFLWLLNSAYYFCWCLESMLCAVLIKPPNVTCQTYLSLLRFIFIDLNASTIVRKEQKRNFNTECRSHCSFCTGR